MRNQVVHQISELRLSVLLINGLVLRVYRLPLFSSYSKTMIVSNTVNSPHIKLGNSSFNLKTRDFEFIAVPSQLHNAWYLRIVISDGTENREPTFLPNFIRVFSRPSPTDFGTIMNLTLPSWPHFPGCPQVPGGPFLPECPQCPGNIRGRSFHEFPVTDSLWYRPVKASRS